MLHAQGQVTTQRLTTLLNDIGIDVSKRQIVRLLTKGMDGLVAEVSAVLHAGLVSSKYITVDDTGARHSHNTCYATQIGGPNFTVFRTTPSKSRLNFLSLLRGNYQDYVLNDAAFDYLDQRYGTDPALVAGLRTRTPQHFCNEVPFLHYLSEKGIDIFDKEKIRPLAEAGIWGAVRHHGLIGNTVIVSDDAGQFRVGKHALCWVHLWTPPTLQGITWQYDDTCGCSHLFGLFYMPHLATPALMVDPQTSSQSRGRTRSSMHPAGSTGSR